MKRLIIPCFAIALATFMSCTKEPSPISYRNLIPVNKCQSFDTTGELLTCCLDSVIQDSRCPIDAVCIWQGIAVARFTVSSKNENHVITLATSNFATFKRDTTLAGFKMEFVNLEPPNSMSNQPKYSDYVAEVRITKP